MKRKPIKKPKFYGCLNCSPLPEPVLSLENGWYGGGVHKLVVKIDDDFEYEATEEDGYFTVAEITKRFGDRLAKCKYAEIQHITPLHYEVYEYNIEDCKWYLVKQGLGYA